MKEPRFPPPHPRGSWVSHTNRKLFLLLLQITQPYEEKQRRKAPSPLLIFPSSTISSPSCDKFLATFQFNFVQLRFLSIRGQLGTMCSKFDRARFRKDCIWLLQKHFIEFFVSLLGLDKFFREMQEEPFCRAYTFYPSTLSNYNKQGILIIELFINTVMWIRIQSDPH